MPTSDIPAFTGQVAHPMYQYMQASQASLPYLRIQQEVFGARVRVWAQDSYMYMYQSFIT